MALPTNRIKKIKLNDSTTYEIVPESLAKNGHQAALPNLSSDATIATTADLPTKQSLGLGNVDNTSDLNKPISTATQTALNGKQATLVSGTNIKTINNESILGSGNISIPADTNYYHVAGTWSGLSYTLTGQGGASDIVITLPTGTSASTVAVGNHNHNSLYLGITAKAADSDKLDGNDSSYYLNYNNLSNKPIFFATYGTTTGEEIAAAIANGQYVCCIYNDTIYGNVALHTSEARYYLTALYGSYTRLAVRCSTTGATWTTSNTTFLGSFKVDNATINASTNTINTINGNYNASTNKLATASDIPTNYYVKPAAGIPASDLAETYVLASAIGTAASKNYTTSVTSGSNDLVTSGAVYNAIDALPEPMVFKGTLGTGGTITSLPAAASSNTGFTYKVITAGTYASQAAKVGDVFVSNGTSWVLIPAGDDDTDTWRPINIDGTEVKGSGISSGTLYFSNSNTSIVQISYSGGLFRLGNDMVSMWTDSTTNSKYLYSQDSIGLNGHLVISDSRNAYPSVHPTNNTGLEAPAAYMYGTGITVQDWGNSGGADIALSYPSQGGVLGLQIDIDDLTQANS